MTAYVSVTRLKLRRWYLLPIFLCVNFFVIRKFRRSPGLIQGKVMVDYHLAFWTLSLWQQEADMRHFRNVGPHLRAMAKTPEWASEAVSLSWTIGGNDFPPWNTVCEKLKTQGHYSTLKYPSEAFKRREFPCEEKFINVMFYP